MTQVFVGIMSGTSLDGIDAVAATFAQGSMSLLATHSEPWPAELRDALLALTQPGDQEIDRMGEVDVLAGRQFAQIINNLLRSANLDPSQVAAIGSHGQTIRHRPLAAAPFTLQIGDPNTIAERTGIPVVADFRRRDVAANGQGAPLVPAFHDFLFRSRETDRIVVNLGGIANITILPRDHDAHVQGFDTGPANGLMDAWHQRHRGGNFDRNGSWAASGTTNPSLLERLLAHPFFALPAPKSTGREDFHINWLDRELSQYAQQLAPEHVQATLLDLTAHSLANAIRQQGIRHGDVILCGGGAYNGALTARLGNLLEGFALKSSADFGLAPTWVEASAFAWLASRTLHRQTGSLPGVTGAQGPRILGGLYVP